MTNDNEQMHRRDEQTVCCRLILLKGLWPDLSHFPTSSIFSDSNTQEVHFNRKEK